MAEHVQATLDRMVEGFVLLRDYGKDFYIWQRTNNNSNNKKKHNNKNKNSDDDNDDVSNTKQEEDDDNNNNDTIVDEKYLLSSTEITSIIGYRRKYEYLLRRRGGTVRQSDYISYIEKEIQLYQLILLRYNKYFVYNPLHQQYIKEQQQLQQKKKKLKDGNDDTDNTSTNTSSNNHYNNKSKHPIQYIIHHIHTIYQRMIRKFQYNYTFIQMYIQFCLYIQQQQQIMMMTTRRKKYIQQEQQLEEDTTTTILKYSKSITKIYTNAIRYHSNNIQLWYDIIQYEYQYIGFNNHIVVLSSLSLFNDSNSNNDNTTPTTTNNNTLTNSSSSSTMMIYININHINAIRIYYQRALRIHTTNNNILLWKSYIIMEYQYALIKEYNHNNNHVVDNTTNNNNNSNIDHDDETVTSKNTNEFVNDIQNTSTSVSSTTTNYYHLVQVIYDSAMKAIVQQQQQQAKGGTTTTTISNKLLSFQIACYHAIGTIQLHHQYQQNDRNNDHHYRTLLKEYIYNSIIQHNSSSSSTTNNKSTTTTTNEISIIVQVTMILFKIQEQQQQQTNHVIGIENVITDVCSTNIKKSILDLLQNACIDMYPLSSIMVYHTIQFVIQYYNVLVSLLEQENNNNNNNNNNNSSSTLVQDNNNKSDTTTQMEICTMIRTVFRSYYSKTTNELGRSVSVSMNNNNNITTTDVVLLYVHFLLRYDNSNNDTKERWDEAIRTLQTFVKQQQQQHSSVAAVTTHKSTSVSAEFYIQYAELSMEYDFILDTTYHVIDDIEYTDANMDYTIGIQILEQEVLQQQLICIHHQPDYTIVLEQLFCYYIINHIRKKNNNDYRIENNHATIIKIQQLLDQLVLIGGRSSSIQNQSNIQSRMRVKMNTLIACQKYIPYLYKNGSLQQYNKFIESILSNKHVIIDRWISIIINEHEYDNDPTSNNHHEFEQHSLLSYNNIIPNVQALPLQTPSMIKLMNNKSNNKTNYITMVHEILDCMIDNETTDRKRLERMYNVAISIFQQLSKNNNSCSFIKWIQYYQQRKDDAMNTFNSNNKKRSTESYMNQSNRYEKSRKISGQDSTFTVPTIDCIDVAADKIPLIELYEKYQIVHVKNVVHLCQSKTDTAGTSSEIGDDANSISWKDIGSVYKKLNEVDQKSWCIETTTSKASSSLSPSSVVCPDKFLQSNTRTKDRAYTSFVVQNSKDIFSNTIQRLPFQEFDSTITTRMQYETALWIFFGRNPIGNGNMEGRPEHTDSISHSGTWHYQLSGTKRWYVRPTSELTRNYSVHIDDTKPLCIDCKEGDILMINTRLWFHRTVILPQRNPSVSYARDFHLQDNADDSTLIQDCNMTNVDGLYATNDITKGTIIFTESDMPDVALHRATTNANCVVVELDDGTNAVMASRLIVAGEFFCIPESSDEDDDDEDEEEEEEDEYIEEDEEE